MSTISLPAFATLFAGTKETEQTWQMMDTYLARIKLDEWEIPNQITKREAVGKFIRPGVCTCVRIIQAACLLLLSDRSKLSGTALSTLNWLAATIKFDSSLTDIFLTDLFKLCTRAHKVSVNRATEAILNLLKHTTNCPRVLPKLEERMANAAHKNVKSIVAQALVYILNSYPAAELLDYNLPIQKIIIQGLSDADSSIRDMSRHAVTSYRQHFPDHFQGFLDQLDPSVRKHLGASSASSVKRLTVKEVKKNAKMLSAESTPPLSPSQVSPVRAHSAEDVTRSVITPDPVIPSAQNRSISSNYQSQQETLNVKKPTEMVGEGETRWAEGEGVSAFLAMELPSFQSDLPSIESTEIDILNALEDVSAWHAWSKTLNDLDRIINGVEEFCKDMELDLSVPLGILATLYPTHPFSFKLQNLAGLISGTNNVETRASAIELGECIAVAKPSLMIDAVLQEGNWGGWLLLSKCPVDPHDTKWQQIIEQGLGAGHPRSRMYAMQLITRIYHEVGDSTFWTLTGDCISPPYRKLLDLCISGQVF